MKACFGLLLAVAGAAPSSVDLAVHGHVRDASERPVCGGWVAAVPVQPGADDQSTMPVALARSCCDGRFRLPPLPPGTYTVTASVAGRGTAFRAGVRGGVTTAPAAITLQLSAKSHTFAGTVRGPRGEPVPGAQLRAHRWSDDGGAIFYSETGGDGSYALTVPSGGEYLVLAVAEGFRTRHVQTSGGGLERLDFELDRSGAAPPEVVAWIKKHAVPIETVEAGHGFRDLAPLRAIIGDAQVVGLGEATHGTREFFQLKHRLFEFLVSKMDFHVLAVEGSMTKGFDLNDYVVAGRGTPQDLLPAFVDSEEMLDALRWMRAYNADPRHERKVKVYGVDMQPPAPAAARVLAYLRRVDPSGAAVAETAFGVIANPATQFGAYDLPPDAQHALRAGVAAVLRVFDERRDTYVARSSDEEWVLARQHAVLVAQNATLQTSGPDEFEVRNRGMAENLRWILEREGAGTRMVLWAHNGHVSREPRHETGAFLHEVFGPRYLSIGFAFNQGGFSAHEYAFGAIRAWNRSFTLGPAPAGSLDATLAEAGLRIAALDLRTIPRTGPVAAWFASPRETRNIGSGFFQRFAGAFLEAQVLPRRYETLLFVEKTTAGRRLSGPR
jgi:erythromycin esterase